MLGSVRIEALGTHYCIQCNITRYLAGFLFICVALDGKDCEGSISNVAQDFATTMDHGARRGVIVVVEHVEKTIQILVLGKFRGIA